VRGNERRVIELEFGKKKYINYFFIRAESSQPQLKLGSFNYRPRLARVILARARLAQARVEPEFFCAALRMIVDRWKLGPQRELVPNSSHLS
jgi:hypothetical protein